MAGINYAVYTTHTSYRAARTAYTNAYNRGLTLRVTVPYPAVIDLEDDVIEISDDEGDAGRN